MENKWIVTLEEDPETGDLVMPIPPEVLNQVGWDFGDTLIWNTDEDGHIVLSKKIDNPSGKEL